MKSLQNIYTKLYRHFGPQQWWPAESAFEVMIGAILTQNTNWANVEKAILNLKANKSLSVCSLTRLPLEKLALRIRPAGYYNVKAQRIKNFLRYLACTYRGKIGDMARQPFSGLRQELLAVKGIGFETADSILLYALHKPVFVVDAYTRRIFSRHGMIPEGATYAQVQALFMRNLKTDVTVFNEYHALLVRLGKEYCTKQKPKCKGCPLKIR